MASFNLPTVTVTKSADDAATPSTIGMRDANGDLFAVSHRSSGPVRGAAGLFMGVSPSQTISFTASSTYRLWIVDSTAGSVTVALPQASLNTGLVLTFKKIVGANNMILDANGGEFIDGALTKTASTIYAVMTVMCDGTGWHVLSSLQTFT